jgi:flagellar FliL protein
MSDEARQEEAKPAAPKTSKLPLVALLVGVLNLGGVGFLSLRMLKLEHAVPARSAHAEPAAHAGPPATVTFDPFIVNLNEPSASRYLKTSFEIEVEGDRIVEDLNRNKRVVRDEFLRYLSSLGVPETQGEESKKKIQEQLIARADRILGAGRVKSLYFTEFVVQ